MDGSRPSASGMNANENWADLSEVVELWVRGEEESPGCGDAESSLAPQFVKLVTSSVPSALDSPSEFSDSLTRVCCSRA